MMLLFFSKAKNEGFRAERLLQILLTASIFHNKRKREKKNREEEEKETMN